MSKLEEYAQHAEECQRSADSSKDDAEKAAWLRLAQSWLWMTHTEFDLMLEAREEEAAERAAARRKNSAH